MGSWPSAGTKFLLSRPGGIRLYMVVSNEVRVGPGNFDMIVSSGISSLHSVRGILEEAPQGTAWHRFLYRMLHSQRYPHYATTCEMLGKSKRGLAFSTWDTFCRVMKPYTYCTYLTWMLTLPGN